MVAIKPRDIAGFLSQRPHNVHVVVVYGPDLGLVRERSIHLAKHVVEDLNDPFNAMELTESDLAEVGRLADEVAALSFMGGERLVRVRGDGVPVAKAVQSLLKGIDDQRVVPNALVVVEAGDLKKSNALRKAAESHKLAATIPCYADDGRSVMDTIRDLLGKEDLLIEQDALGLLAAQLGEDRGITRAAAEGLILFKGPKSVRPEGASATVTLEDVRACLADSAADATFEVVDRALGGDPKGLSEALFRAEGAGVSPLGLVRIAQGKLLRLLTAQRAVSQGDTVPAAIKKVRPPIFFTEQRGFERQLKMWPLKALEIAQADLLAVDLAAKTTGAPQRELVERCFLRLAASSARRA